MPLLRPIFSLSALLLTLLSPSHAGGASWVKVLADEPGRLEIELHPPALDLRTRPGGPVRPVCGGCQGALTEG
ncbi:MAG TPA: hypothetical protein VK465_07525, partial [Fibrobacteria bacterium]|nr:hypothetical protein [Fibrobacteria bacterium]